MNYTLISIIDIHGTTTAEVKIPWQDEDGPSCEQIADTACALLQRRWLVCGDKLTIEEHTE